MRRLLFALAVLVAASGAAHAQTLTETRVSPEAVAESPGDTALAPTILLIRVDESEVLAEVLEQIDTDKRFGIGTGSAFNAFGISGTYDVNETITAEAILGIFGSLTSLGGRVWYRFNRNEGYDLYGFGGVSFLSYGSFIDEDAVGVSGGVGIEVGLPQLIGDPDFPPIFLNADIGLGFATFDAYDGFSLFGGGGGIHFRF